VVRIWTQSNVARARVNSEDRSIDTADMNGTLLGGDDQSPAPATPPNRGAIPWRHMFAAAFVLVTVLAGVAIIFATAQILLYVAIAGFIAVVLAHPVAVVQARLGDRRGLASAVVILATTLLLIGLVAVFLFPLRHQISQILSDLPGTMRSAARGRGPLGPIVRKLHLETLVHDHERDLAQWATDIDKSSFAYVRAAVETAIVAVTVMIIAFFLLTQTQTLAATVLTVVPYHRREFVRSIARDCGAAISGYMTGNLAVSAIAGVTSFVALLAARVPNAAALAAWIAFTDLIPLVGATLGAIAVVVAAFLHSTQAGVILLVFFVVYQQIENNVLQPAIMRRTVHINPLAVLLSVIIGVKLIGYWGALFAIPIAGITQIVARAFWQEHQREGLIVAD
jgi:predicted PurR-regulated permease PerM